MSVCNLSAVYIGNDQLTTFITLELTMIEGTLAPHSSYTRVNCLPLREGARGRLRVGDTPIAPNPEPTTEPRA